MTAACHPVSRWHRAGLILALLSAVAAPRLRAQEPRQSPAPPPAKPSSPGREDPLDSLLLQARTAIDKNDFSAALDPLQKYIAQRPDEPYAHFQLGYAYSGLKRWEEAKAEFARAIALDPKMAPAHLNLGLVLIDRDPVAAAQSFQRAAELQPGESRPRFLAGYALERAGKFTEAIAEYRSALGLSPQDYEVHFALGRVLLRTGSAADAEEHFRAAVAARGDSAPARLGLANALLEQKKYDAGAEALADYLKLNPADHAARLDRTSALIELDRLDDALEELDRAENGSAPSAESLKMRGDIYLHQKKWQQAGEALTKALSLSPRDPDLPAWLGHVKIEQQDYTAAITLLGQAYAVDPKSPGILHDLANAFFLHQDYAAALGAMDRLAALEPPAPMSWFIRGICYDRLTRKAEAIEAYQKFLDLDNAQDDAQTFQARRRIVTLQNELRKSPRMGGR
jgi:Flp pilus assembly protein TadD